MNKLKGDLYEIYVRNHIINKLNFNRSGINHSNNKNNKNYLFW